MEEKNILIDNKIIFYRKILDSIQISVYKYKLLNIISNNDYNICIESVEKVINLLNTLNYDNLIVEMEYIQNNISLIIKNYGINNFDYLFNICLDSDFCEKNINTEYLKSKLGVIKKYLIPINYRIINWNNKLYNNKSENKIVQKNKLLDDKIIVEDSNMLECFDLMRLTNNFNLRVYGIKVIIHDVNNKKTLSINCIIDNLIIYNIQDNFIIEKKKSLNDYYKINSNKYNDNINIWNKFIEILSLKDYLIYSNEDIIKRYLYLFNNLINYGQKTINDIINDFIGMDLFNQRQLIINLLLDSDKNEFQYIAYLLYDLLSNDNSNNGDSNEQKELFNTFPIQFKKLFKEAMYKTIEYTNSLSNFDNSKIPLEQQICLMKANKNIKERAMQKLKEIKSKSEDSGSKARQYLDGLLKIPFSLYKEEEILKIKNIIINIFNEVINNFKQINVYVNNEKDNNIISFLKLLDNLFLDSSNLNIIEIKNKFKIIENNLYGLYIVILNNILNSNKKKKDLILFANKINNICIENNLSKIKYDKSIISIKNSIKIFFDDNKNNNNILKQILLEYNKISNNDLYNYILNLEKNIIKVNNKNNEIVNYINNVNKILNTSIHGHKNAKIQIERIIAQWINGEMSGYCFGFEGPPGVGKTTLAKKGLANCLMDNNNISRPFSFIALGGSSNGSTLEGHNYTYVGSTWGKIVDIIIEKKCMNPIIFIDELDKVSKTEHGREIIGILTHLTDTTQNDSFQDKYFSNIDLDLSKVLFIFSYNDVEQVDKILLDRIHRIKFSNLQLDEKITICLDFLLPELYNNFGLNNIINFSKDLIKFIIENYTNEPGVRKLKELLFEIISSINIDFMKNINSYDIPMIITKDLIQKILKDKHNIQIISIKTNSEIGLVNGLWANAYGNSGILHIETKFYCTNNCFELKLTGMQGDVMKESMNVSKTLAWNLLTEIQQKSCLKLFEETKNQGIHIHVPEGSTPKDGPSAGCAITLAIYSLLVNKKIRNNYALTGEICLNGDITAIGSLDLKILGGIKAGVKTFLYPRQNIRDFNLCYEKYKEKLLNCNFYEVSTIYEVINYMLI